MTEINRNTCLLASTKTHTEHTHGGLQQHLIISFIQSMLISPTGGGDVVEALREHVLLTSSTHTLSLSKTHARITHTYTQASCTHWLHCLVAPMQCRSTHTRARTHTPQRTWIMRDLYATSSLCKILLRVIQRKTEGYSGNLAISLLLPHFKLNFSC